MPTKSANVTVRVQPEIKQQAEAILERIGLPVLPVSVLIDTLYRQIIMTGGVPYPFNVPVLWMKLLRKSERVFKYGIQSNADAAGSRADLLNFMNNHQGAISGGIFMPERK